MQPGARRSWGFCPASCFNLPIATLDCCSWASCRWVSAFQELLLPKTACTQARSNLVIGLSNCSVPPSRPCPRWWCAHMGILRRVPVEGVLWLQFSMWPDIQLADRKGWVYWNSTANLTLSLTFVLSSDVHITKFSSLLCRHLMCNLTLPRSGDGKGAVDLGSYLCLHIWKCLVFYFGFDPKLLSHFIKNISK